ncbi:MAG: polyphosphate kinase 1 [Lentisphaeria bacterium]|nr:polyphosphate kinase 1 [Lentisphaeria bacterium]
MASPAEDIHPPILLRDDSWLAFNARVLEEAMDPAVPLLERAKFLSIFSSNLDEFFMVRIAGLARHAPDAVARFGGRYYFSPHELRERLIRKIRILTARQYRSWERSLRPALAAHGIRVVRWEELPEECAAEASALFEREYRSALTPVAVDPDAEEPPVVPALALELLIRVQCPGTDEIRTAFMQVPTRSSRFLCFESLDVPGEILLLPLEELVGAKAAGFFPGCTVLECAAFRVTRDRDLTPDEDTGDLLSEMQAMLRKRGKRTIVRLETSAAMSAAARAFLMDTLGVTPDEHISVRGTVDLTGLMDLVRLPGHPDLLDPPLPPLPSPHCPADRSMFDCIRDGGPFFLHVPYESFDPVIRLLSEAADDPDVIAIKQTLYRVGQDPPVVHALIRAAQAGKQVTVYFEIMARFDEENNIRLSRELADAGAHVVYGVPKIKVHAKMLLIVRREGDEVRRYLHLPTGNYNCSTVKQYTDIGLFTCDDALADDVSALFHAITGLSAPASWKKIIAAPYDMRGRVLAMIDREAALSTPAHPGGITLKLNALQDPEVIEHLYEAARRGVRIDMVVRGICAMNPASLPPEAAANVRVVSIVDRFLEHSRIYRFANGGAPEYFIGSADLMPRNLSRRVEILVPVESAALRDELDVILFTSLHDRRKGRRLTGENRYSHTTGTLQHESERAQVSLYNYYKKRLEHPDFPQDAPGTEY